jgi:hypothetical protein
VHRDPFVQSEGARAVRSFDDLDVLVGRLRLVQQPRGRLDRSGRDEQKPRDDERQELPEPAEQQRAGEHEEGGGAEHRTLRPEQRNRHDGGQERPEDAADRGERVEPPGDRSGLADVAEGEANGERSDRAEEGHGDGEESERGEERPHRRTDRYGVEPPHREIEDGPGDERRHRDHERSDDHDQAEEARVRSPVGHLASEPVPEREVDEDEPDDVRPDDGRAAEVRR